VRGLAFSFLLLSAACSRAAGDPAPGASASAAASVPGPTAKPLAVATPVKHFDLTLGPCSFAFDGPAALAPRTDNTASVAVFMTNADVPTIVALYHLDADHARVQARTLDALVKDTERRANVKWLERTAANDLALVVWDNAGGESRPEYAIEGRVVSLACDDQRCCRAECSGPRSAQQAVVDACKSARITIGK
jgi:hypothetical protein